MNKRDIYFARNNTARRYHVYNCPTKPCARNHCAFNTGSSWEHEQAKAKVAFDLQQEGKEYITEAWDPKLKKRRDIVCLDDGIIYEIETDPNRAIRFLDEPADIVIIPVGWTFKDDIWTSLMKKRKAVTLKS